MGVRQLLSNYGFNLTKFMSNNKDVINSIPQEARSKTISEINVYEDILPAESVLGILWDPEFDLFKFKIQPYEGVSSKRNVLSVISRLYDVDITHQIC